MSRDILFKTDEQIFSYRVGGILIHNGKMLVQRVGGEHAVIGGHVSMLETTRETLKREFWEEIHAHIEVDDLLAVQENFFRWGSKPCHQVHFYYFVHLTEETIPMDGVFHGYDDLGGQRFALDFVWMPLEELEKVIFYPAELLPYFKNKPSGIVHFVSNEL